MTKYENITVSERLKCDRQKINTLVFDSEEKTIQDNKRHNDLLNNGYMIAKSDLSGTLYYKI